jgi:hypothetical protein
VPGSGWMRCVSGARAGAGAYDKAAASGRGAGHGLSFHLLWLWVGIGGGSERMEEDWHLLLLNLIQHPDPGSGPARELEEKFGILPL